MYTCVVMAFLGSFADARYFYDRCESQNTTVKACIRCITYAKACLEHRDYYRYTNNDLYLIQLLQGICEMRVMKYNDAINSFFKSLSKLDASKASDAKMIIECKLSIARCLLALNKAPELEVLLETDTFILNRIKSVNQESNKVEYDMLLIECKVKLNKILECKVLLNSLCNYGTSVKGSNSDNYVKSISFVSYISTIHNIDITGLTQQEMRDCLAASKRMADGSSIHVKAIISNCVFLSRMGDEQQRIVCIMYLENILAKMLASTNIHHDMYHVYDMCISALIYAYKKSSRPDKCVSLSNDRIQFCKKNFGTDSPLYQSAIERGSKATPPKIP